MTVKFSFIKLLILSFEGLSNLLRSQWKYGFDFWSVLFILFLYLVIEHTYVYGLRNCFIVVKYRSYYILFLLLRSYLTQIESLSDN